jgi:hypothetical protein
MGFEAAVTTKVHPQFANKVIEGVHTHNQVSIEGQKEMIEVSQCHLGLTPLDVELHFDNRGIGMLVPV